MLHFSSLRTTHYFSCVFTFLWKIWLGVLIKTQLVFMSVDLVSKNTYYMSLKWLITHLYSIGFKVQFYFYINNLHFFLSHKSEIFQSRGLVLFVLGEVVWTDDDVIAVRDNPGFTWRWNLLSFWCFCVQMFCNECMSNVDDTCVCNTILKDVFGVTACKTCTWEF